MEEIEGVTEIEPDEGDTVVMMRTEGPNKDVMYLTTYPKMESPTDVVIARCTTASWYSDLNNITRKLSRNKMQFSVTPDGMTVAIPDDFWLESARGMAFTNSDPTMLMRDLSSFLAQKRMELGGEFCEVSVVVPKEKAEEVSRAIKEVLHKEDEVPE